MTAYFHGGAPDLKPGDLILPRAADDTRHLVDGCPVCAARAAGVPLPDDDNDPSLVYATTSRVYARLYAGGYPYGDVYRVEVEGSTVPSNDPEGTGSVGATSLRVVSVLERAVTTRPTDIRRLQREFGPF